jgi:hypothetical protein
MSDRTITLQLPEELLAQLQQWFTDQPDDLHRFVIQAIEHELQNRQQTHPHRPFWAAVNRIRSQMDVEGIDLNPDEIWGDVRDLAPGREVNL